MQNALFGFVLAILAGLTMGLVLKKTELKFRWWQILLLMLGWFLAWFMASTIVEGLAGTIEEFVFYSGLADATSEPFSFGLVIGAIFGIVGGALALGLILWSQRDLE
jgi:hypothetical protein